MHNFIRIGLLLLLVCPGLTPRAQAEGHILISPKATALETYAASELQRYLYQVSGERLDVKSSGKAPRGPAFVIGQPQTHPLLRQWVAQGLLTVSAPDPGPQGYVLKTLQIGGHPVIVIAGSDAVGCLYGVYGLLEDHYQIRFGLGGDILPDRTPLRWASVDERKTPSMRVRGLLPWTNFPQSATVYSWEDWRFILDQMARMRLNFLHIHNYNGELGHNEMFHNFTLRGHTSRVWMATVRTGHKWACPGWDVNQYRFGAADLFDDYDWGSDCALHNEGLSNEQVFRKGVSLFQQVIAYAHRRGIQIGLGLDINLIPPDYQAQADDPEVVQARVQQLATDYPDLDYLLCFQSEGIGRNEEGYKTWRKIFMGFYDGLKARAPRTRLAVAGWGLDPKSIAELPADVICAPISHYSASFESGASYGNREYWGCPWLERDFNSSEYYYPYNMHLSDTMAAFAQRAPNMQGFYCLTWRLTDAVDAKMGYIAQAPWDTAGRLKSSQDVYLDHARHSYGPENARALIGFLDQNEPYASDFGECQATPPFAPTMDTGRLLNIARFNVRGEKPAEAMRYSAADYAAEHGVRKAPCDEGGECVGYIEAGDWLRMDNIDFGDGATLFEARVATVTTGGRIELRLEGPTGPVIGACEVRSTGGWQNWITVKTPLKPTRGRHALHMSFLSFHTLDGELAKAEEQLAVIDRSLSATPQPDHRARLSWLRCRLAAARDHIKLNQNFDNYAWQDLPGAMDSWVSNFTHRVMDISSLGNVMSTQNRFVQLNYVARESNLLSHLPFPPPTRVEARGTPTGARLTWEAPAATLHGFHLYRDGRKLTSAPLPATARSYVDKGDGPFRYTVTALGRDGQESPPSVPAGCAAGRADTAPPFVAVISPPTTCFYGQGITVKARLLDNRAPEHLRAELHHRAPGSMRWRKEPMTRRARGVFVVHLPFSVVGRHGLEYYVLASDGANQAVYPAAAPAKPLALTVEQQSDFTPPGVPHPLRLLDHALVWERPDGDVYWYRIYRGDSEGFKPGPENLVTYVDRGTRTFRDEAPDFDGKPLPRARFYRVTAVDRAGNESPPTPAALVIAPASARP